MEKISQRLFSWASILDTNARAQAQAASTMPFIHPHLALMPDAHLGKGATVGSVIPTLGAIIPAAVGVDIGCGMIAVKTAYAADDLPTDRRALREAIERAIPLSAGNANQAITREHTRVRLAELRADAEKAGFDPAIGRAVGRSSSARWARATTSSRSASTRTTRCGCSCTRGRGASAT